MEISAKLVKDLRDRTGAGMMECKKALVESKGDIEIAIENMRKAGQAKADKKSSRIAAEGVIKINISEINSGIKKIIYFERVLKSLDNLVILISLKFNFL